MAENEIVKSKLFEKNYYSKSDSLAYLLVLNTVAVENKINNAN